MAIWQFNLYFIPRQAVINRHQEIPKKLHIDIEGWNKYNSELNGAYKFEDALTTRWWNEELNESVLTTLIARFAKPLQFENNNNGLKTFGDEETNDIHFCFDNNNFVEELSCRIDLRKLDAKFINSILSLSKELNCLLMDRKGNLIEPNLKELELLIQISNAAKFVNNPTAFFEGISNGTIRLE